MSELAIADIGIEGIGEVIVFFKEVGTFSWGGEGFTNFFNELFKLYLCEPENTLFFWVGGL